MTVFREKDPLVPVEYSYEAVTLYSGESPYGSIKILESTFFGRMLVLNDIVQLTEWDEHIYHEMLVHVPLHVNPRASDVLIIGGGDGGSLREVLKHKSVKKVTLVEIDETVIEISRKYLTSMSSGFSDTRTHIVIADGAKFVAQTGERFDIIIVDSTDPIGAAQSLSTEKFLSDAHTTLNADGLFVIQTESLHFHRQFVCDVQAKLARRFKFVDIYTACLATYTGNWWTFSIGSKEYAPNEPIMGCQVMARYYAEDVHRRSFLPESLYRRLVQEYPTIWQSGEQARG